MQQVVSCGVPALNIALVRIRRLALSCSVVRTVTLMQVKVLMVRFQVRCCRASPAISFKQTLYA